VVVEARVVEVRAGVARPRWRECSVGAGSEVAAAGRRAATLAGGSVAAMVPHQAQWAVVAVGSAAASDAVPEVANRVAPERRAVLQEASAQH